MAVEKPGDFDCGRHGILTGANAFNKRASGELPGGGPKEHKDVEQSMADSAVTGAVYWPLWIYLAGVLAVIAGMLSLSFVLGQRSRNLSRSVPYESGISSTGSAHGRFYAGFFLMAIFFVIFDLESVFVMTWAIAAGELGWAGYGTVCVFIGALFVSLIYLWREGALES